MFSKVNDSKGFDEAGNIEVGINGNEMGGICTLFEAAIIGEPRDIMFTSLLVYLSFVDSPLDRLQLVVSIGSLWTTFRCSKLSIENVGLPVRINLNVLCNLITIFMDYN